jgi:integrase
MQAVIDDAAASGSEKAASRLKDVFANVDKFAVQRGVLSSTRTKRLLAPHVSKAPTVLSDQAFKAAWEALSFCGDGGAVIDRAPCLAILLSAATLQPLGKLVQLRRSEVDFERQFLFSNDPIKHVHLSDIAVDLIRKAIDLGDFSHREVRTEYVLASGGPKRDPARPVSYSLASEVVRSVLDKSATPHDLRQTGIASLQALGGEDLRGLVTRLSDGGSDAIPDTLHVALLDGWAERIRQMTK